jgi:hypothetical protein
MNLNPEKRLAALQGAAGMSRAFLEITLKGKMGDDEAYAIFDRQAVAALLRASKCPDLVMDRGHWFGEALEDGEKVELMEFLKTL